MKVDKLATNSRNSEVNVTTGLIIRAHQESTLLDVADLTSIIEEIDPINQQLTLAIKRMKAESELETMDELRDTAHRALYVLVQGASYSTNPTVKAAAEKVLKVLERYRLSATIESYDTETSLLDSMLRNLEEPALQESIAAITSCNERILILQKSQDNFIAARLAFRKEQALEGQKENATRIRKQLVRLINGNLVDYLNGMLVRHATTFIDFAATVKQIIAKNNENAKKRQMMIVQKKTVVG